MRNGRLEHVTNEEWEEGLVRKGRQDHGTSEEWESSEEVKIRTPG